MRLTRRIRRRVRYCLFGAEGAWGSRTKALMRLGLWRSLRVHQRRLQELLLETAKSGVAGPRLAVHDLTPRPPLGAILREEEAPNSYASAPRGLRFLVVAWLDNGGLTAVGLPLETARHVSHEMQRMRPSNWYESADCLRRNEDLLRLETTWDRERLSLRTARGDIRSMLMQARGQASGLHEEPPESNQGVEVEDVERVLARRKQV